jgi:hypothetical protein
MTIPANITGTTYSTLYQEHVLKVSALEMQHFGACQ